MESWKSWGSYDAMSEEKIRQIIDDNIIWSEDRSMCMVCKERLIAQLLEHISQILSNLELTLNILNGEE